MAQVNVLLVNNDGVSSSPQRPATRLIVSLSSYCCHRRGSSVSMACASMILFSSGNPAANGLPVGRAAGGAGLGADHRRVAQSSPCHHESAVSETHSVELDDRSSLNETKALSMSFDGFRTMASQCRRRKLLHSYSEPIDHTTG